jgi:transcription antitermination factor NusG
LGYELGVAITGHEDIATTLILTEGFGEIAMARRTFDLLAENEGKQASVSGATQIRAGVIRPEVIIPSDGAATLHQRKTEVKGLETGDIVRIIREPHFGKLGSVVALPPELQELETGAKVRVLELELESGERVILPRANIEAIEE